MSASKIKRHLLLNWIEWGIVCTILAFKILGLNSRFHYATREAFVSLKAFPAPHAVDLS
jgi:hypothetical protein